MEGALGQPISINPVIADANEPDQDLIRLLFAGLGTLAERIQSSDDHKTWNVHLKPDLVWSDSAPLTSDDVLFTLETIQNPQTRSPLLATWQGVTAERLSALEVRFSLRAPYAFFENNLREFRIVPEHIFGTIPSANLRLSTYNLEPVGSGPFQFDAYRKRRDGFITEYALAINPRFAGRAALIQTFTFRFYQTLEEAIAAFNRKEIHGLGGLDARNAQEIKIGYTLAVFPMPRYYAIFLNPAVNELLKEPNVREALARAVDRDRIVENVLDGHASPQTGPLPPPFGSPPRGDEYNKTAAEKILEDAKWIKGTNGIRSKLIGKEEKELRFELVVPRISFLAKVAERIQADWRAIGVETTLLTLSPAEITDNLIKTRNYSLLLFGNILRDHPDTFSFWHSTERFYPGLNLSLYENKNADALLESIRRTFDPETQTKLLRDLETLVNADRPAIFLFTPQYLYVHPKSLGGVDTATPLPVAADRFNTAEQWFLKTARVFAR